MGIHHFFKWFKTNFSGNIKSMPKGVKFDDIEVEIDNLMIDLNGVFHTSAQKAYEYGAYQKPRSLLRPNRQRNQYQTQLRLFKDVCDTISFIKDIAQPKKRIILCIDGPAPLSKQNQQRQRRFRSASEQVEDAPFNSNAITPGTKFMDYLSKYIDWFLRKKISEDDSWQNLEIVFSNEKAPGEGEHKIINYIRHHSDSNDTFCIHGMDADLIMLALGTHMENFYILREDVFDASNEFFCIDIGNIRGDLAKLIKWDDESVQTFDDILGINDFIFLCFMVGNDFLPHIPSIEIIEDGLDLLLEVYREVGCVHGHITQNRDDTLLFSPNTLQAYLRLVGMYEQDNLERKMMKKDGFFKDEVLEGAATQEEDVWHIDIDKYKRDYMAAHFSSSVDIEEMCHDYLEGLQWVLSYYTSGVPNWRWNYKYHYAPPASILSEFVNTFSFPEYGRSIPTTPFQQLLCVLPPKSADLIPEPLSSLLTNSPLSKYCPETIKIDLSGKRREWEGKVILPMVDFGVVEKYYNSTISDVDPKDARRNVLGRTFVYFSDGFSFKFKSHYGDINNCVANVNLIDL